MTRRIALDDPGAPDVRALLEAHLALMRSISPPGSVHALEVDRLRAPGIEFYSMRDDGQLVGVGALKALDAAHGEIKSMHTAATARRTGAGGEMLEHLLRRARERGFTRVSLETGSPADFAAPQALYRKRGFRDCGPFADYTADAFSLFLTIDLHDGLDSAPAAP